MNPIRLQLVAVVAVLFLVAPGIAVETTHKRSKTIKVQGTDGKHTLQTLAVDGEGRILALVAPTRYFNGPSKDATGELHVLSPEGEKIAVWKVDFHASAVNVGPKGNVYVAGAGRIAKFSPDGKKLAETELAHVSDLLKNSDKLRESAKAQLEQQAAAYATATKTFEDRLAVLEKKDPKDRSQLEERQIEQYKQILKSYQARTEAGDEQVEAMVRQLTSRLGIVNAIAVSGQDVFVASGESEGYGYGVWRMDHDLKGTKQVLKGMRGCCGQFDIQVAGSDLLTAENTRHQWARYDRDGKAVGSWGKRGQATEEECFGGCCNPMNLCASKDGDIFTSESEGIIKRFTAKGEFLGTVAKTSLSGGCKNVAVGLSPTGDRVYLCDQPGSQVIVLQKIEKE